jgi:hypothetical protein
MLSLPAIFKDNRCDEGGTPVIGSSFVFSWPIVHEGVIRRSDEALSDMTMRGMSAMVGGCFGAKMALKDTERGSGHCCDRG